MSAAARDEQAALQHLRQELRRQDCRAGQGLEVRSLPVHQLPGVTFPVPDWTTRLRTPGNRFEDADTGATMTFNCTYNGRDSRAPA